jgi:hypothetical protein
MKTFKSKVGLEIVLPICVIIGGVSLLMIYESSWLGLTIIIITAVFILHLFLTTDYTITEDELKIKSGFVYKKTIKIVEIKRITETRDIMSSPANSIDRLEITFNNFDRVLVSPKEKTEFIRLLTAINPDIKLKLKS